MANPKVLVSDPISQLGVDALGEGGLLDVTFKPGLSHEELLKIIPEYSALVVRSQTKVGADVIAAAKNLKAIGRAGVGVDNVDVEAATARGIVVMNTPGGNTISTAEHAFSLLVSVARKIPQADASVKCGKWDRKSFQGVELNGKTLAILGMGRKVGQPMLMMQSVDDVNEAQKQVLFTKVSAHFQGDLAGKTIAV